MTLERGERERLPGRRNAPTMKARIGETQSVVYIRAGEYPDGRLGEIFVTVGKRGLSQIDAASALDAFAIAMSIALQYGAPLDAFVRRFVGTQSDPSGVVVGHDRIRMSSSLHDLLVRHLAIDYLGRDDLANVP